MNTMLKIIDAEAELLPLDGLQITAFPESDFFFVEAMLEDWEVKKLMPQSFKKPRKLRQSSYDSPPEPTEYEEISFREWFEIYGNDKDMLMDIITNIPAKKLNIVKV